MTARQQLDDQHGAGVHLECTRAPIWAGTKRIGDGTSRKCPKAGTLDRFHSHDYDGPLVCGCRDFSS